MNSGLSEPLNSNQPRVGGDNHQQFQQHEHHHQQLQHQEHQDFNHSYNNGPIKRKSFQSQQSHNSTNLPTIPLTREQGRLQRRQQFYRAVYSEFVGTLIFFIPIYGVIANSIVDHWDSTTTTLATAMSTGFIAIPLIFCFSSLSGAQFNPAITFALWITKKQSTRKFLAFTLVQFIAPFISLLVIWGCFPNVDHNVWYAISLKPAHNATRGNVFFTEMTMTFILTFIAFAMAFEENEAIQHPSTKFGFLPRVGNPMDADEDDDNNAVIVYNSTPQSKSGFTPFGIGFFLVAVVLFKGGSCVGMNPARYLAPAVFADDYKYIDMYILGEYVGAMLAGLLVVYGPQSSQRPQTNQQDMLPNVEEVLAKRAAKMGIRHGSLASTSTAGFTNSPLIGNDQV